MYSISHRGLGLFVALSAGAALGLALASERWGGLVPCALCLVERWPYRVAILLGLLAAVAPRGAGRVLLWLSVLVFVVAAAAGVVHVGVENGAWASPLPECAAPRIAGNSVAERLRSMPAAPSKSCDEPTYLIPFLPVSMAAMNVLYACLSGAVVMVLLRRKDAEG